MCQNLKQLNGLRSYDRFCQSKHSSTKTYCAVLIYFIFIIDTQEAPRSLSLESSSSVESLASIDDGDLEPHSDGEPPPRQHRRK